MNNKDKAAVIKQTEIFSRAGEETLSCLLMCRTETFSAGDIVYSSDSFESSLCIILSGRVVIFGAADGKSVKLRTADAGEIFGAAALFGAEKYVSTVKASRASEVLFVGEDEMTEILSHDSACMLDYVSFLSQKIRFLNEKITAFTAKSADAAVAEYIKNQRSDEFPVNMSSLSRQLDIGRTSLYRSVEKLARLGAIEYDGGKIKIISKEKLNEI